MIEVANSIEWKECLNDFKNPWNAFVSGVDEWKKKNLWKITN